MLIGEIEKIIKNKTKEGFIYPRYDGHSFYNILPTIFALFGKDLGKPTLPQEIYQDYAGRNKKLILFLIDGFGYDQFIRLSRELPFLKNFARGGKVFPITSIFPSTTSAALTTIHSGLSPQEHGLLEWYVYFDEIDQVIQTLPFSPLGRMQPPEMLQMAGVDPEILFSGKTIYPKLKDEEITPYLFQEEKYLQSSYTRLVTKGANIVTWRRLTDLMSGLRQFVSGADPPFCTGVYFDGLDHQGHEFGKFSQEHLTVAQEFFEVLQKEFIEKIEPELARDLIILLTADHGQINVDPSATTYLNDYKEVVENLAFSQNNKQILPWGSPREVFLKIKEEKVEEVFLFLQKEFKSKALVIKSREAFKQGLFGVGSPHIKFFDRIGDLLIIPFGNQTIWYEYLPGERLEFKGCHGGLSKEEMLIPFGIVKASELQK
ncbi:MAG: alkaline phosphatase family protein [bacterium]|nr:alkaline phosphatase family protein [bacterium]